MVLQPLIFITYEEFESLRIVKYEGLSQEEAEQKMVMSRATMYKVLTSTMKKVAQMLVEGESL